MKVIYLLLLVSFLYLTSGLEPKCRALVLSGGGAKGSYQAGVIFGVVNTTITLSQKYPDKISIEEVQYDVISGTSVGSINAIPFILYPKGEEMQAVKLMTDIWGQLNNDDIFTKRSGYLMQWLFQYNSLLDSTPLKNSLLKYTQNFKNLYRMSTISAVNLNTGITERLTEQNFITSIENLVNASMCSSAIPGVFPPQTCGDQLYIDGGSLWNLDIEGAIQRCRQVVDQDKNIIVDVFLMNSQEKEYISTDQINSWSLFSSFQQQVMKYFYQAETFVQRIQKIYPSVQFRHVIYPKASLSNQVIEINFNPEDAKKKIKVGYEDGEISALKWALNQ